MTELEHLAERVRDAIPLTRHLAFRFTGFDGATLTLTAPLAPNHNDKGTFFAGSQVALLTLAGWACTTLLAEALVAETVDIEGPVDVVAVEGNQRYRLPLDDDLTVITTVADDDARRRFRERLMRRGKATLTVDALATNPAGDTVCEYQGLYLARLPASDFPLRRPPSN
ncbi:thioesterase domain-containing protein [Alcanivorax marinus]|uniref:Thioesterase domain-containing protein n=1 Tax=Alloalcanivorax marinus TaxID=1177169 RepID=A0A9Q3UJ12_9GAMM|nr:YiiD C-terminal domain-containing protein [Alloalcanivorax marinus]MCC4307887.1 thioesterase domain-containing protein [Alloalcanivorax marinus]